MTSSLRKKCIPASIISRWLSLNPSVAGGKAGKALQLEEQQQEIYRQLFFPHHLEVMLVRHLACAPTTCSSSSSLATHQWVMESVFVLREQFKCRAMEKSATAHDRQMYTLIFTIFLGIKCRLSCFYLLVFLNVSNWFLIWPTLGLLSQTETGQILGQSRRYLQICLQFRLLRHP